MNYANWTNTSDIRLHVMVADSFQAELIEEMFEVNRDTVRANNFTLSYLLKPVV